MRQDSLRLGASNFVDALHKEWKLLIYFCITGRKRSADIPIGRPSDFVGVINKTCIGFLLAKTTLNFLSFFSLDAKSLPKGYLKVAAGKKWLNDNETTW